MPPKSRISRDMIIDAAFDIARADGAENINARTVAKRLGCSTQPIMYHFKTIEDLKKAVYAKVDLFHTQYLMNIESPSGGIMLGIGINYIRFAVEEPQLFKFLFQSGYAVESSLLEMVDSDELLPVIGAMQTAIGLNTSETKKVFLTIAMFAHGYASIIANNSLTFDEEVIKSHLERAYRGAILALNEEANEKGL